MLLRCPSKLACLLLHVYLPVRACVCVWVWERELCLCVCVCLSVRLFSVLYVCVRVCVCEKSKRKRYAANSGRKVSLLLFKNVCQCMCIVKGIINNRRSLPSLSLSRLGLGRSLSYKHWKLCLLIMLLFHRFLIIMNDAICVPNKRQWNAERL